ncbi:uncharacterized protein BJX67DRAFT_346958 [Aspergillus lucknowensis]|uniref:Uncharacterized protein n=1 Tax=Aspergillus lucknowensis TaxID=176173 RepID=A0ABR4LZE9_9EURO
MEEGWRGSDEDRSSQERLSLYRRLRARLLPLSPKLSSRVVCWCVSSGAQIHRDRHHSSYSATRTPNLESEPGRSEP